MSDLREAVGDDDSTVTDLLTHNDRVSPTWSKLRKYMEARQQQLRARNENPKLDEVATALLRGELRALKNLLALGTQAPAEVADEGSGE